MRSIQGHWAEEGEADANGPTGQPRTELLEARLLARKELERGRDARLSTSTAATADERSLLEREIFHGKGARATVRRM